MWISKERFNELIKCEEISKDSLISKAQEADEILKNLGVEQHTESGKQIRASLAMELLGQKYDLMDKHSKASFVKDNSEVMEEVRQMLQQEGIMSRKKLEHKKK